ncbi:MAG: twin-arginine translocase TatA/TatE family subunit [Anaerolineales bacterium]|nr:twin-arginine translocase TatA/TatE family subunit [Anaerolineales bacterium]
MIGKLGWPELLILLAIVVLVFGVGRIGKIAGELGSGIQAFRKGLEEKKPDEPTDKQA